MITRSYVGVRIAIDKLFEWLFSRVLASQRPGFDSQLGNVSPATSSLGWIWPWSSLFIVWLPTWSVLFDSEYVELQLLMSWQLPDAFLMPCKCYSAYILVQFTGVHVCSSNICTWGSHVSSFKQFEWLFSRVLALHRGLDSRPGQVSPGTSGWG